MTDKPDYSRATEPGVVIVAEGVPEFMTRAGNELIDAYERGREYGFELGLEEALTICDGIAKVNTCADSYCTLAMAMDSIRARLEDKQ